MVWWSEVARVVGDTKGYREDTLDILFSEKCGSERLPLLRKRTFSRHWDFQRYPVSNESTRRVIHTFNSSG